MIGAENQTIKISEPIFLSKEEQKYAKFYTEGLYIKTYLGRGQYRISKVLRQDDDNNKLILKSEK